MLLAILRPDITTVPRVFAMKRNGNSSFRGSVVVLDMLRTHDASNILAGPFGTTKHVIISRQCIAVLGEVGSLTQRVVAPIAGS